MHRLWLLDGQAARIYAWDQPATGPGSTLELVVGDAAPASPCWFIYGFSVLHGTGFFGVDLNRNYPFAWGIDDDGSSSSPASW